MYKRETICNTKYFSLCLRAPGFMMMSLMYDENERPSSAQVRAGPVVFETLDL